jgi:MFS family permease
VQSFHPTLSVPEVQAQVVPLFVVGSVVCLVTAVAADRLDHRCGFALLGYVFTIVGFAILRDDSVDSLDVTMMALYFIAIGTFISLPMIWSLTLLNLATPFQRAIGVGFVIGIGNVSGYISSWIFKADQAPWYRYGMTVGLILTCVAAGLLLVTWAYMASHNRAVDDALARGVPISGRKEVVLRYRA